MKIVNDYLELLSTVYSGKRSAKIKDSTQTTWSFYRHKEMDILYDGHSIVCGYFVDQKPHKSSYFVTFEKKYFVLHRDNGLPAFYKGKKESDRTYFYYGDKIPVKFKNCPAKYLLKRKITKIK